MSKAREALQQGNLSMAVEAGIQAVKAAPSDVAARILLFEALSAAGDFERAAKHLEVVAQQSPGMFEGVTSYIGVLKAEQKRAALLLRGEGEPEQVTPTPFSSEPQLSALRLFLSGDSEAGRRLLDEADAKRPPVAATVDGVACEDFCDADDFFAATLEVIAQGRYGWIPFTALERVVIPEPKTFRDLLWAPSTVHLVGDLSATMFLPVRYFGSETHSEDRIRLARVTDWVERDGLTRGLGQRAFVVGEDLRYLADIREIAFER